jgi:hypothetical protein
VIRQTTIILQTYDVDQSTYEHDECQNFHVLGKMHLKADVLLETEHLEVPVSGVWGSDVDWIWFATNVVSTERVYMEFEPDREAVSKLTPGQ